MEFARQPANLRDGVVIDFRRMAAALQNRQHQRRKLVPAGDAGEADAGVTCGVGQRKGGYALAGGVALRFLQLHALGLRCHVPQKAQHFFAYRAIVNKRRDVDGFAQIDEQGL